MSDTNDLFEIRLSDQGIKFIKKFSSANTILLLLAGLLVLLHLSIAILRFLRDKLDYSGFTPLQVFYFKSNPYLIVIHVIFFGMQLFYFWNFRKLLEEGIRNKNELAFNRSFRAIYLNAIWGIVTLVFGLLTGALDAWYIIEYLI